MSFLSFTNIDIEFVELEKSIQKYYNTLKTLQTSNLKALIKKTKFVKAMIDEKFESLMIYMIRLEAEVLV